jgi:hypothetical protein
MTQDLVTRQAFWLLQKYSSYTWKAEIAKHYTILIDSFEKTLRIPPTWFVVDNREKLVMRSFWDFQSQFEDGLAAIARGDKYSGYAKIKEGFKLPLEFYYDPIGNKEQIVLDSDHPHFKLGLRSDGVSLGIFRELSIGETMCSVSEGRRDKLWFAHEEILRFANPLLHPIAKQAAELNIPLWINPNPPALPLAPEFEVTITSGKEIPITGIWLPEPVQPYSVKERNSWRIASETYCMNYLVQGVSAPEMTCQELELLWFKDDAPYESQNRPDVRLRQPVIWKLLWADDRYGENGIPANEVDYLRNAEAAPDAKTSQIGDRCDANQPCPRTGYWSTPAKQNSRQYFNQGEIMPDFTSLTHGNVIWYWDNDQTKH